MNKVIIPAIVAILVLSIGLSQDVYAPNDQPERLTLGGTGYNSDTGNFEIDLVAKFGMAKALQKADFSISIQLTINSPELPAEGVILTQTFPGSEASPDEFGRFKVKIPWDRALPDGSSFEGSVDVLTEAQILNPAGKSVGNSDASRTDKDIVIRDS